MNQSTARRPEPLDALREWGGPAQMSAFEASMWLAEADPRLRTTVTGVMVLDRAPDWQRLVDGHQRMVNAVVRLRQRVLEPALGLGLPQWVDDPDFQLQYHLRRQTLAAPGTQRQLLDMAQIFAMTPFDRSRPPWEGMVVEGLENGRAAYVLKLHHVLSDGIGLTQLFAHAVSQQRESRGLPVGAAPRRADAAQSALELAAHNARQRVRELPGSTLGALAHSLEVASTFLRRPDATQEIRDYLHSAGRIVATRPVAGSPILRRRSRAWRFDPIELPFAGLKTAAHTLEASINDVFLAGLLGGLRRYHDEMGVQIDQMPIAFPISLRKQGDAAGGNHFAGAQYAAPVGERDPRKRLAHVHAFVRQARQEPALDLLGRLAPLMARLPAAALGLIGARLAAVQDAQISNVPGFNQPMYVAGAQVLHNWGFGPAPGCAMMIGMTTYNGVCSIGVTSDRAAVIEPELLADCLRQGLQEMIALGSPPAPRTTATARKKPRKKA